MVKCCYDCYRVYLFRDRQRLLAKLRTPVTNKTWAEAMEVLSVHMRQQELQTSVDAKSRLKEKMGGFKLAGATAMHDRRAEIKGGGSFLARNQILTPRGTTVSRCRLTSG